ncbi:hypothetical protein [Vibrio diabolicus]|uniref:hypothetical protein n=1 Tax=Vibrio diabolicus TaxID=50719 RepID=UPI002494E8E9|nr:hypothetical protein [Vibrio diabolicus]
MDDFIESHTSESTVSELKNNLITMIKSNEYAPELITIAMKEVSENVPEYFESYKANDSEEEIISTPEEWVLPRYFDKHCRFLERNFSRERVEHLIRVKSHLIEFGVLSLSNSGAINEKDSQQEQNNMNTPFSKINMSGFNPTSSFQKSLNSGDVTQIRMALFMEMNDHRLPTQNIKQMIAYSLQSKPNLFLPYEENGYAKEMNGNKTSWDAKYYALQEVYASSNFSVERIQHMLEVREEVFSIPKLEAKRTTTSQPYKQQKGKQQRPAQHSSCKKHPQNENLKALVTLGGAIAAIAIIILALA